MLSVLIIARYRISAEQQHYALNCGGAVTTLTRLEGSVLDRGQAGVGDHKYKDRMEPIDGAEN